jgi:hypothetical protein
MAIANARKPIFDLRLRQYELDAAKAAAQSDYFEAKKWVAAAIVKARQAN